MNEIPDFWRTEIWHPLSVHFPVALLTFATIIFASTFIIKGEKKKSLLFMALILLSAGVLGAWTGIYTGNMADGVVSRQLCDPTILKDHEISAYTSSILFSIALAFLYVLYFNPFTRLRLVFNLLVLVLMLTGTGFLIHAGHLGAQVVYQQGGGVYHPSQDCYEFE